MQKKPNWKIKTENTMGEKKIKPENVTTLKIGTTIRMYIEKKT